MARYGFIRIYVTGFFVTSRIKLSISAARDPTTLDLYRQKNASDILCCLRAVDVS